MALYCEIAHIIGRIGDWRLTIDDWRIGGLAIGGLAIGGLADWRLAIENEKIYGHF